MGEGMEDKVGGWPGFLSVLIAHELGAPDAFERQQKPLESFMWGRDVARCTFYWLPGGD
jgi:hypothetical protein